MLAVFGEPDVASTPVLEAELLCRRNESVVVDLRELEFIDSTGSACSSKRMTGGTGSRPADSPLSEA